jgi:hypothetical protein
MRGLQKLRMFVIGWVGLASALAKGQSIGTLDVVPDSVFCQALAESVAKRIPGEVEDFRRAGAGRQAAFRYLNNLMIGKHRRYFQTSEILEESESGVYAKRWISMESAVASAFGASSSAIVIQHADELRQIPMVQEQRDVILITSDAKILNQERVQLLTNIAERKQIRLFALWTGSRQESDENSGRHWLAALVLATAGRFVDFSAGPAVCR